MSTNVLAIEGNMRRFVEFINERELVRAKKEAGLDKPWTRDPMLLNYRFCNVRREDDKVTRWIKKNWRDPYDGNPNMNRAMLLARMVNWPDTLEEIGFPEEWHARTYMDKIAERMQRGEKTWTGAYMITAEHDGTPKHVSVCKTVDALHYDLGHTCLSAWAQLQLLPRIGSFMAAQVVADLKHTHVLRFASDVLTFCAPGPGSQRGLAILLGVKEQDWPQPQFQALVSTLADPITHGTGLVLDNQDIQNCLCEFSKYVRGSSRSRYNGYA